MNSSLRSSAERQSTSLAGSARWRAPTCGAGSPGARGRRSGSWPRRPPCRAAPGPAACCPVPAPRRRPGAAATTWATIRTPRGCRAPPWSALELRFRQPHRDHRGEPLEDVLLGDGLVPVLQQPDRAQLLIQGADQGPLEAGHVGAALGRGDHVHEGLGHRAVAGVPAQRHVDGQVPLDVGGDQVALAVEHRHGLGELPGAEWGGAEPVTGSPGERWTQNSLIPPAKRNSASSQASCGALFPAGLAVGVGPLVGDPDGEPGHEVRGLPGPLGQRVKAPLRPAHEHLPVRPEPDPGAGERLGHPPHPVQPARLPERRVGAGLAELAGRAAAEADRPLRALPVDPHIHPAGQGVDHRRAHAVQAARGGVGAAAELAARVQPGHHQLDPVEAGLGLDVDRDPAAVVPHLGGMVLVQDDVDAGAVTGQGLVHRVVDELPEAVQQPAAVGGPDVHAGALAHRLEPLEDRQVACGVSVDQTRRETRASCSPRGSRRG